MPKMDKTGPTGAGPMTGRGIGPCGAGTNYGSGLGRGRGYGRVMCGWFWRKYQAMNPEERKELLKSEIKDLKQEQEIVREELKELEK